MVLRQLLKFLNCLFKSDDIINRGALDVKHVSLIWTQTSHEISMDLEDSAIRSYQ
jgi:hypothetical protein